MEELISVSGFSKQFTEVTAVDDISFSVGKGEMFGLVGPDGAGKTTTIRTLCGLISATRGKISVLGLDIRKYRKRIQDQIGYLSQRFSLYGDLSIDENIEFFARIHGVTSYKERRDELLDMMRLTPFRKRLAERLSGGMKQKLALACSLIHTPKIIFLDEPTTGVDPVSRRDFWKILSDLQGQQITIFMTTPYLDEAERCNRVAVMHQGKILMLDSAKQIKRNAAIKSFEVVTSQVRSAAELLKAELDFDIQLFGDRLNVLLPVNRINETDNILNILSSANLPAASTRITEPSLENVFIYSLAHLERSET